MEPASATTGFFQESPVLKNQFHDDASFQRVFKLFVPPGVRRQVEPDLSRLGDEVLSEQIFSYVTDAEKNLPYLKGGGRDAFARPQSDVLVVTEGWRKLQEFGIEKGVVAYNYDTDYGPFTRTLQFLRIQLWESSAANTPCPAAMTDGAARLLQLHLARSSLDPIQRAIFQNAFEHLTSRDPDRAWTSGQWMTERPGGSDVSRTETVATYAPFPEGGGHGAATLADYGEGTPLGPWSISGFKFFSSATDASMAVLLARTRPGVGLSAFLAPMRRHNPSLVSPTGRRGGTELNGVRIQRLKDKLGTKSLPTAELELRGMRGWLLGEEGQGVREISTVLNITRVHSAVAAMGYLGRGLAIARAYALVREIGAGKGRRLPLCESPLHMRTLAGLAGEYHAMMLLTFFTTYVLGLDETAAKGPSGGRAPPSSPPPSSPSLAALTPPPEHVTPLLRVLSSLHKAYCCKQTVPALLACMESLGGVGYLQNHESEHLNLSRLFRDACVLPIWEGTTDVLSSDTLRALQHPATGARSVAALDWLVRSATAGPGAGAGGAVARAWAEVKAGLAGRPQQELQAGARDVTFRVAEILMAALLLVDAGHDETREAAAIRDRFLSKRGFAAEAAEASASEGLALDVAIVYGAEGGQRPGSKL